MGDPRCPVLGEMWEGPVSDGPRTWPSGLLQGSLDFLQGQAMTCSAQSFPCQTEREDSLRHQLLPGVQEGGEAQVAHGSAHWSGACFGELDLNSEPDNETVCCFKAIP